MKFHHPAIFVFAVACFAIPSSGHAEQMSQDEVVKNLVGKQIVTRSFGVQVQLYFAADGTLTANSLLGDYTGSWERGPGEQICSTFDSGPAKGTQCNTYTQTGEKTYKTSSGTKFAVK